MKSSGRFFLIDGSSFCYRAFYAIRALSTSKGQPTNAVYGVVAMLRKLVEEERPDYLAVAFDLPKPTFRHRRYESYKIHRKPMPAELVDQIPWIKQVLQAWRIPIFEQEGFEADDILGTLALRAVREGLQVFLVTGDKDALQLVGPDVRIYRPLRDGHEIIDEKALEERWRIRPDQIVEMMGLMGDETDAIPGVPGIGEKTALDLIQRFGSVEKLLRVLEGDAPSAVRPSVAKAIRENRDQLQMSRELATLDTEVPLTVRWEELKRGEGDREALHRIFQTLEFRVLAKEFMPESRPAAPLPVESWTSAISLESAMVSIRRAGRVALVIASDAERPMEGRWLGVGLAWAEESAAAAALPADALRVLLEDLTVEKICPHLKETWIHLEREGCALEGPLYDPVLASYLLDAGRPSHSMADWAMEAWGEDLSDPDPLKAAAKQALTAWKLADHQRKEIQEKELSPLLNEVEIPLARVLARMERHGIAVDPVAFQELGLEITGRLEILVREIYRKAEGEFNINSPKQLGQVLFERLKLPVIKRTKTGPSTDEEVLRLLAQHHDLPRQLLEYRELAKLKSTYVEALPRMIHPESGRIHASFNQTVTATGRLSSSDPNLQNIPIRTELGRRIRRGFVPSRPEGFLVAADYSQIELRILAHLSGDEALLTAFRRGEDIHQLTASEMGTERAIAKTINFGIIYGMSPFGLAKELGLEFGQAEEFITRYFKRYPGVKTYLTESLELSRRRGYCLTLLQRRRTLPELSAQESTVRQFAERMAVNAPVQGSAADLIKVAMIAVDQLLQERRLESRMVCQVHDELIFDVPKRELSEVESLVRQVMENPSVAGRPIALKVPIVVQVRHGRNWYEASHG